MAPPFGEVNSGPSSTFSIWGKCPGDPDGPPSRNYSIGDGNLPFSYWIQIDGCRDNVPLRLVYRDQPAHGNLVHFDY